RRHARARQDAAAMAPSDLLAHPLPEQAAGAWSRCLTRLVTSLPYRCMGAPGMPRHVASPGGPSTAARGDLNLSSTWYAATLEDQARYSPSWHWYCEYQA